MAQFENLPLELLQSIIRDILDELWGGVHTKQFLDSRRVCREKYSGILLGPGIGGSATGCMVLAVNKATDYAVEVKRNPNPTGQILQSTRAQYSRVIAGLLWRNVDMHYADFLAGTIKDRWTSSRYQVICSQNEAHALAVLGAAGEGDVAMLQLLLSQARFDPPPGLVGVAVLSPLALAIRGQHSDGVRFLLARWDSHGDVDCPDAPGPEGEYPIHVAACTGSIPLVELFISRADGMNANATTRTRRNGGMTPLDIAAAAGHVDLVKYLFGLPQTCKSGGAGVLGGGGKNTLYYAVQAQNMEIIRFLLAQQENVITAANWADSPLAEAASLDKMDIIELLDSKGRIKNETELGVVYHGCLLRSIVKGDMAMFNYFLGKPGLPLGRWVDDFTSVLTAAVHEKQDEMFEKLVVREEFDCRARRSAFMQAVWLSKLDIAQRLIDVGGLDLESAHNIRADAIQYVRGRREVFEFLKRSGILGPDVQMPDW